MDVAIAKVTYDRKSRERLSEEITGKREVRYNFDIQVVEMFLNGMLEENIIPKLNFNTQIA